jgi:predicted ATPase/transcriptional regulator with XRE-family HTH domain
MTIGGPSSFGVQLKALREAAGFTQEELATIAGLSVHAVSALERGERRRPHVDTVRALSAALDLTGSTRDALVRSARMPSQAAVDELSVDSLPLSPTVLIGRESDLQTLGEWFADPASRLITLIGPGGVGKTRLAVEVARAIAEEGSTRVVFVSLAPIREPAFVAPAVAEALGLGDVNAADLSRRARAACADRPTLLVLDNFEQVLAGAPLVADLLTSVAALRLLVTSRAPLRVRGEKEYVVGPLELKSGSEAMQPADLARAPAVRLFVERVREVQPDFRLTRANGPTVTEICRRLDALPLALELAAPWIKVLTEENLLRRLTDDVLLSTVGPRDLPERQQTTNATVAWSYQLLDQDDQLAFRRFGALPGLFPLDAAAEALGGPEGAAIRTGEALRAAASLMDKSLLLRAETSAVATCPLYYMLETVRAYAVRELIASGERDDAMEGVVRYTLGEAARARDNLFGPSQVVWLDRVREDLESYRAAMTWLIERGRAIEAAEIASSLTMFWAVRGFAAEAVRWYEEILNLSAIPPAAESRILHAAALMYYLQGELVRARTAIGRSYACAQSSGNIGLVAQAANLSGHIQLGLGDVKGANDQFSRSVETFQALAIPWGAGNSLTGMAAVALATRDLSGAERLIDEALATLQHGAPLFVSLALYVRAVLAVRRGNGDEAIAIVRESLTHIRQLQDKFAFVYALVPLAAAAALKGDDAWAARILGARDHATERTGAKVIDTSLDDLEELSERAVRARLGPVRWALAFAVGRTSSIDALLKDIDAGPQSGTSVD